MINFLLLDTETTDLKGHCIQLAYRNYEEDKFVKEFNGMFAPPPGAIMHEKAQEVHGISMEELKGKPYIGTLNPEFQELLNKSVVVCHNAEFDCSILERDGFRIPFQICTVKLARHFFPTFPKHQLQYLRKELSLDVDDIRASARAHDALGDVLILEELFFRLLAMAAQQWHGLSPKEIFTKMINISRQPRW